MYPSIGKYPELARDDLNRTFELINVCQMPAHTLSKLCVQIRGTLFEIEVVHSAEVLAWTCPAGFNQLGVRTESPYHGEL